MTEWDVLVCPLGRMLDYMACIQIENGANQKVYAELDDLANIK